jgi:dienelactone hydrolase
MRVVPVEYTLLAMAWLCAGGVRVASAQTLQVVPDHAMVDESVSVRAGGLEPGEKIVIHATLVDGAGKHWTSEARFLADTQGAVDTSKQAPVSGSYKEISSTGLIWSMKPAEKHTLAYTPPADLAPQPIEFRLGRASGETLTAQLQQSRLAEGVQQIKVQGLLHGVLFVPGTAGPHAGVLVLGGWEGGVPREEAAWLASHGFAAFALAYFRYEDLPKDLEGIPLEYFGSALTWMMNRLEILPDRIAVVGSTRGAELALQLGSMYGQIKAVVAYTPSSIRHPAWAALNTPTAVPYAWTWHGQPLGYMGTWRQAAPMAKPAASTHAAIEVEQTRGPILLICGEVDEIWPSSMMADAIVARLKYYHFSYRVEVLKYRRAGHRAGQPEIDPSWQGALPHPISGRVVTSGGSPEGNAESSLDAIPKVLEFLRTSLEAPQPSQ